MINEWSWNTAIANATKRIHESVDAQSIYHVRSWQYVRAEYVDHAVEATLREARQL